jgi:hypothetical protein
MPPGASPQTVGLPLLLRACSRAPWRSGIPTRGSCLTDHDAFDVDGVPRHDCCILDTHRPLSGANVEHL